MDVEVTPFHAITPYETHLRDNQASKATQPPAREIAATAPHESDALIYEKTSNPRATGL
jgi:hypothetical protein